MDKLNNAEKSTKTMWAKHVEANPILYPDERLVGMLKSKVITSSAYEDRLKGLDIGFGSGRHLKLMMDCGIESYGIEYAEEAITVTKKILNHNPLLKELWLGDYRTFNFPVKFDVIISWGSFFLYPYSKLESELSSLSSKLSDTGSLFINFRTLDNWFYGLGESLEPGTFLLDKRAGVYEGSVYTFLSLEQIENLIVKAGLQLNKIERLDLWKNNLKEQNSWYVCELTKT
jgi:hypothetical protein